MHLIEAWFDGCCEPYNPGGHASFGALIKVDGETVWQQSGYVGNGVKMSNNVAEYAGAIACMKQMVGMKFNNSPKHRIVMRGDSKLVINQLQGFWRVRGGLYVPHYKKAHRLHSDFNNIFLEWVPRDKNGEADVLSKQVLKDRGVEFRLQSE